MAKSNPIVGTSPEGGVILAYLALEQGRVISGIQDYSTTFLNASSSGNTELVAAVATQRIRVLWAFVTNGSATTRVVRFESATTAITADHRLLDGGGWIQSHLPHYLCQTVAGEALNFNLDGATAVGVDIGYILV